MVINSLETTDSRKIAQQCAPPDFRGLAASVSG